MGFNKNPAAWIVVAVAVLFVIYRLVVDIQAGDGPVVAIGVGIAVAIVVVALLVLNRSGSAQLAGVTALKPHSLVKPVIPSTPGMQVNKQFARSQGLKAKGGMTAQVASFDPEAVTIWTGGKQPKVHVSVPSSAIRSITVRQLAEGMRTYNALALQVDDHNGILVAIKDRNEDLRAAVFQIADAIGLDHRAINFS